MQFKIFVELSWHSPGGQGHEVPMVFYIHSNSWLLADKSRDLSQAEQIDKMTINSTIFNIIWGDHIIDQASDVPSIIFFS